MGTSHVLGSVRDQWGMPSCKSFSKSDKMKIPGINAENWNLLAAVKL